MRVVAYPLAVLLLALLVACGSPASPPGAAPTGELEASVPPAVASVAPTLSALSADLRFPAPTIAYPDPSPPTPAPSALQEGMGTLSPQPAEQPTSDVLTPSLRVPGSPTTTPPPGLIAWPTPTPWPTATPWPLGENDPYGGAYILTGNEVNDAAALRAKAFVAEQERIPLEQLLVQAHGVPVMRPSTGASLTFVFVIHHARRQLYEVLLDEQGAASYLPDYTGRLLDQVAQKRGISRERLEARFVAAGVRFPLSPQLIWEAKIYDKVGGEAWGAAVDLDGNEVSVEALEQAEQRRLEARQARCPKLDVALCDVLLSGADPMLNLAILPFAAGGEDLERWLAERGVEVYYRSDASRRRGSPTPTLGAPRPTVGYDLDRRVPTSSPVPARLGAELHVRMSVSLLVELAALDYVARVGFSELRSEPINSNLRLEVRPGHGGLALVVTTQSTHHSDCWTRLDVVLHDRGGDVLELEARGLLHGRFACLIGISRSPSSLSRSLALPSLEGEYELVVTMGELRDRHRLIVDGQGARLETLEARFTWTQ